MSEENKENNSFENKYILGAYFETAHGNLQKIYECYEKEKKFRAIELAFPYLKKVHHEVVEKMLSLKLCEGKIKEPSNQDEKNEEEIKKENFLYFIDVCLQILNDKRNEFTHEIHVEKNYDLSFVAPIYDNAYELLNQRFELDDFAKSVISGHLEKYDNSFLIYFCTLFLNKREVQLFLSKNIGFKNTTESYKYTRELYSIHHIRVRRESDTLGAYTQQQISLNIFSELLRCPNSIFKTLSPKDKKAFIQKVNLPSGEEEILFKRYRNRFETLCLKGLEYLEDFKEIGFYIYVGTDVLKEYDKKLVTGEKINRCLLKRKACFNKLSNITETDYEQEPYYVINQNKIGLSLKPSNPPKKESDTNVSKQDKRNPVADFWLSKYELPAMALYAILREEIQKEKGKVDYPSVKEILEGIKGRTPIPRKRIKIEDVKRVLNDYKSETNKRIKRLEKYEERDDKDSRKINFGKIATDLLHDIVWLQPVDEEKNHQGKMTGANFQALQCELSHFSYTKQDLLRYYKDPSVNLVHSKNEHPFLEKINPDNYSSLLNYSLAYYKEKIKYIEKEEKRFLKKESLKVCKIYPLRKRIWKEDKDKVTDYHKEPIHLPRGIFEDKLLQMIQKDKSQKIVGSVRTYFEQTDALPEYYSFKRCYPVLGEDEFLTETERLKKYRTIKKSSFNKNEKIHWELRKLMKDEEQIRFERYQDIVLFKLAKYILGNETFKNGLFLKDFSNYSNNVLDKTLHLSYEHECENKKSTIKIISGGDDTFKLTLRNYKSWENMKTDPFIKNFLEYLSFNSIVATIGLKYIEDEISYFIDNKYKVIQHTQEIEAKLIHFLDEQDLKIIKKDDRKGGYYNFNDLLNKTLEKINWDKKKLEQLICVRNMVAHNQYKPKNKQPIKMDQTSFDKFQNHYKNRESSDGNIKYVSQNIFQLFKDLTKEFLSEIDKVSS